MLIVLTTVPDAAVGEKLAESVVEERLAACVQILPQMTSVYRWKGEVLREAEHLLLIKTNVEKWADLRQFISANHPYEIPEIVAIKTEHASLAYLDWLTSSLRA